MKNLDKNFIFLILFVFFMSCSTKKNRFTSRTFHNTVAKYNVYFNGKESFKIGKNKIEDAFQDNYTTVLPVFVYGKKSIKDLAVSDMDKTIRKCSKVIKKHSITVKPKKKSGSLSKRKKAFYDKNEFCKWVDDSHFLMGKAHFYKHDFKKAEKSFNYILTEYAYEEIKYDALIWLARTYNETKSFTKAKTTLDILTDDRKMPKKYKKDFLITYADFFLKQRKWEEAIITLKSSIKETRKRKWKARYKFILAQVYQKIEEYKEAFELYKDISKMNGVPYDMVFNAKINSAVSFDVGLGNSAEMKKQLKKMLKDEKNISYKDQIYFAMANIFYKEDNEEKAIENFKMSAKTSIENDNQKAASYLALGDIYFKKPNYADAQFYYDSAMTYLEKNFPDYDQIKLKTKNLNELIKYDKTVNFQDSMQVFAGLDENTRNDLIDKIIERVIEEEQERKLAEEEAKSRNNDQFFDPALAAQNRNSNRGGKGKWYFYNQQSIQFGESEFSRKWGKRELEDNWRRKNKASTTELNDEEELEEETQLAITDIKTPEYYLQLMPLNDSLMKISHKKIKNSLFKMGKVYKNKLLDYKAAVETFENLNIRYPENSYKLTSIYYIYQSYVSLKDNSNANFYKTKIIQDYPKSKYARMFTNPNFWEELKERDKIVSKLYTETYNFYNSKNYQKVIKNCKNAKYEYPDSDLIPKFDFLNALAFGKTKNNEILKQLLIKIVNNYPESDVKKPAEEMINYLENDALTDEERATRLYKYNAKSLHYYFVILKNSKKIDVNSLKFNFYDFNSDNYKETDFKVSSLDFNKKFKIITIKTFDNKDDAMSYYGEILENNKIFGKIKKSEYQQYIISAENFEVFYKDKVRITYKVFFEKYYLK